MKGGKKKKQVLKFTLDCTHPVEDGIMDAANFVSVDLPCHPGAGVAALPLSPGQLLPPLPTAGSCEHGLGSACCPYSPFRPLTSVQPR